MLTLKLLILSLVALLAFMCYAAARWGKKVNEYTDARYGRTQ